MNSKRSSPYKGQKCLSCEAIWDGNIYVYNNGTTHVFGNCDNYSKQIYQGHENVDKNNVNYHQSVQKFYQNDNQSNHNVDNYYHNNNQDCLNLVKKIEDYMQNISSEKIEILYRVMKMMYKNTKQPSNTINSNKQINLDYLNKPLFELTPEQIKSIKW